MSHQLDWVYELQQVRVEWLVALQPPLWTALVSRIQIRHPGDLEYLVVSNDNSLACLVVIAGTHGQAGLPLGSAIFVGVAIGVYSG